MPRSRKTSTQPKRKQKTIPKKPEIIYPEFIENFKKEVVSKTPFTVKVDQYSDNSTYHIGVLQKQGNVHRCIWMVNFASESSHLNMFWVSEVYKNWKENAT
jgi:hypothetical protein